MHGYLYTVNRGMCGCHYTVNRDAWMSLHCEQGCVGVTIRVRGLRGFKVEMQCFFKYVLGKDRASGDIKVISNSFQI